MMKNACFKPALIVLLLGVMPLLGYADIPGTMSYQGYLSDTSDKPVDGTIDITFSIPNTTWTETHQGVQVKQGVFGVLLGSKTSLTSVDFSQPRLLRIDVNGTSQTVPLSSVPYALHAKTVDQGNGWVFMYQHDKNGTPVAGNIHKLAEAIRSAADVKVSFPTTAGQEFFNCEWTYAADDGSIVTCMNTSHISIRALRGEKFGFQDNAYHWFVMVNTNGKRDMSRWSVGAHTDRQHTQDREAFRWFVRY